MFAVKCEHVRFLQDFIAWLKWPQTETAQTKMSPDRNDSDRIGQTKKSRTRGHRFFVM